MWRSWLFKSFGAMIAKSVEDIRGEIVQRKLNLFEVPPNTYIMTVSVPGESAPFDEEFDKTIKMLLEIMNYLKIITKV
jgi:hypothetical protein